MVQSGDLAEIVASETNFFKTITDSATEILANVPENLEVNSDESQQEE